MKKVLNYFEKVPIYNIERTKTNAKAKGNGMKKIIANIMMIISIAIVFAACGGKSISSNSKTFYDRDKIVNWQEDEAIHHDMEFNNAETLDYDKAKRIVSFYVRTVNVTWTADEPGNDYWKTSEEFENDNYYGDCDDIAGFFYTRLRTTGVFNDDDLTIRVVDNYYDGPSEYHVIVAVKTNQGTIIIDNGHVKDEGPEHLKIEAECNIFAIWG
jgi:predicted transglutaminase-like cysteine proteinase